MAAAAASRWRNPGDHHERSKHHFEGHTQASKTSTTAGLELHPHDGGFDPALHHAPGQARSPVGHHHDPALKHSMSTADYLQAPVIFADSPHRNRPNNKESERIARFNRKKEGDGSAPGEHRASGWRNPGDHHEKRHHHFEDHTLASVHTTTGGLLKHQYDSGYDPALHHEQGSLTASFHASMQWKSEHSAEKIKEEREKLEELKRTVLKPHEILETEEQEMVLSRSDPGEFSFDEEIGEHPTLDTGLGTTFAWKSPTAAPPPRMSSALRRISKSRSLPHYATKEYMDIHYNPDKRPSVLDCQGFVPMMQAASTSNLLQRDVTDSLIVLSAQGDENKQVFGEAGFTEELLNLVESPDLEVRCNAVQSLANLMSHEHNRRDFYAMPRSIDRFVGLTRAKVLAGTRVQPGTVRAMRSAAQAIAHLAQAETAQLKQRFLGSGMIKVLVHLTGSKDRESRHTAARGLLWLCQKHGSKTDKWQRPGEITTAEWTSEQLAMLVDAADSEDPEVVMQVLLGVRCVCTPAYVSIILLRTKILSILCKAMKGNLFAENFPLLMAAVMLLSALSQTTWPQAVLEDTESYKSILSHLLNLLPKQPAQVVSMQSAKGVMSTWDEATLAQKVRVLTQNPEATMGMVAEVFPDSFRQLQCYVLVGDVLEVMEKLMLHMTEFRQGLFFEGAAQHFITIHIHTRYKVVQMTCLRLVCLMVGSEKLAHHVSHNTKLLEILDFALRYEDNAMLPRTCVISIKELSKDKACVEALIGRGLVQALGHLTQTNDPHMQINLLVALCNLASNLHAKEQIVQLPCWPKIIRWADSFDPHVRQSAGLLFAEISSGDDSELCREKLADVVKEIKTLLRLNKIDPEVARCVMDFVNETNKVVKAQSMFRGLLGRKRSRMIRSQSMSKAGHEKTSAVQQALAVFSPPQKVPDDLLKAPRHLEEDIRPDASQLADEKHAE